MKPKLRRVSRVAVLPALLTLGNLLSGFAAIYLLMKPEPNFTLSAYLIFIAMAFDMLDGKVARYTKTASNFGAQLDSLSDLVSFGLTPAFLMLRIVDANYGYYQRTIWVVAAFYVACAALRLARFNAETDLDEGSHQYFKGLPTPGAAALLASMVLVNSDPSYVEYSKNIIIYALPFMTLLVAAMMISRLRYIHFMNRFSRSHNFVKLIEIVIAVLLVSIYPFITMMAVFSAYALSGPIVYIKQKIFSGQKAPALANPASSGDAIIPGGVNKDPAHK